MYTYQISFHMTSGAIVSYDVPFDEKQDPDKLTNDIMKCKFRYWKRNKTLHIVNLTNVEQIVVTGPL